MRPQILAVCLIPAAFVTAAAFVACGGTEGTGTTNPLASREPPGTSVENPNSGQDPASGSDEPPGTTGGGTNGTIPVCMNPPAGIVACEACIGESCGAVLSPVIASCSAFLTCFHNCACTDGTCISNCAGAITSACETAVAGLETCDQSCASACSGIDLGVDGDGGVSGSGPGTSTPVGTGAGACSTLASCCTALPGGEATACDATASDGNDSACASELSGLQGAGICN